MRTNLKATWGQLAEAAVDLRLEVPPPASSRMANFLDHVRLGGLKNNAKFKVLQAEFAAALRQTCVHSFDSILWGLAEARVGFAGIRLSWRTGFVMYYHYYCVQLNN